MRGLAFLRRFPCKARLAVGMAQLQQMRNLAAKQNSLRMTFVQLFLKR
jgi:hypothetical protein